MWNLKTVFATVALFCIVPVLGIIVSGLVSHGYEKKYESTIIHLIKEAKNIDVSNDQDFLTKIHLKNVCRQNDLEPSLVPICNEYTQIKYLGYLSISTFLFSFFIFLSVFFLGIISMRSRNLLFFIFRPGLFFSQIFVSIYIAANAVIIIFSIYYAESYYLERVHFILLAIVGLITSLVALGAFIKAFIPLKESEIQVIGKTLTKSDNPLIWNFVEAITNKIDTKSPDSIIVGMDPTFFVTESKVMCLDGNITGKTLYLSLPFCRTLTKTELAAIIGHEMGHFIGKDTKWSKKFYPIYKGSIETIFSLESSSPKDNLATFALLPATFFMYFFIYSFQKAEKNIARERELAADKIGITVASPVDMASALLKVHLYQHVWKFTIDKMHEALSQKKQIINLSVFFNSTCASLPNNFLENEIGKTSTPHPADSHPSLSVRLDAIGVGLSQLYANGVKLPISDTAIELIENPCNLEEALSEIEHVKLINSGAVIATESTTKN